MAPWLCFATDEFLGSFHRNGGIAAIGIGADGAAEFLVQGRNRPQERYNPRGLPCSTIVSITTFNVGHGGGQQRGHAQDVGLFGRDRLEIVFGPGC